MNAQGTFRHACRFLTKSVLPLVFLGYPGAASLEAAPPGARVELECKIVSAAPSLSYRAWIVEVRKADGETFRRMMKGTGETIRLKHLVPGIYTVCLMGNYAKEHCESVDLTPPTDKKFFKFKKRLQAPEASMDVSSIQQVNVSDLSIPKAARDEMIRSEEAELRGNPQEAVRRLEHALAIYPNYPRALNNLGVHYYRARDYPRSVRYLRKATEINPDLYGAWANLGSSILALGKFEEALEVNKHAYGLRPNNACATAQLALNYYYLHNYAEAKRYFGRAVVLDPLAASSPQLFLAQIAIIEKQETAAENHIQEFLKLHPNSPQAARLKEVLVEVRAKHLASVPPIDLGDGP